MQTDSVMYKVRTDLDVPIQTPTLQVHVRFVVPEMALFGFPLSVSLKHGLTRKVAGEV